jgi:hypothetical protein
MVGSVKRVISYLGEHPDEECKAQTLRFLATAREELK